MEEDDLIILIKILSIIFILIFCFFFGLLPFMVKSCRINKSFLRSTSVFSSGLFLGMGILYILPKASRKIKKKEDFPYAYFIAFVTYTIILFIKKIIFCLINFEKNVDKNKEKLDESYERIKEDIDKNYRESRPSQAALVHRESSNPSEGAIVIQNEQHTEDDKIDDNKLSGEEIKKIFEKRIISYVLFIALIIHGFFQCLSLGIQSNFEDCIFLLISILVPKWAEAFSLGVWLIRGRLNKKKYIIFIILFSLFGILGLILGIVITININQLVEGIFLAISAGVFIYISCSEIITEEFKNKDKKEEKISKYFLYLFGAMITGGLTVFEYYFV